MDFETFKALREQIQRSSFSRQQLLELFGDTTRRVCDMDEPEFEQLKPELSDLHEAYTEALDKAEARESLLEGPDPCDLARDRAIAETR